MPPLIKDRAVVADRWTLLREAKTLDDVPAGVAAIVPLALWRSERAALLARGDVGVWLAPTDDPVTLADDIAALPLIAVDFPKFTDGRGYSIARLLRDRLRISRRIARDRRRAARSVIRAFAMRLRCLRASRRPRRHGSARELR